LADEKEALTQGKEALIKERDTELVPFFEEALALLAQESFAFEDKAPEEQPVKEADCFYFY